MWHQGDPRVEQSPGWQELVLCWLAVGAAAAGRAPSVLGREPSPEKCVLAASAIPQSQASTAICIKLKPNAKYKSPCHS